jgi:ornithine cyclodeaminase
MQIIDETTLRACVREPAALAAAEEAFRALAEGRVTLPPPMHLAVPGGPGEVHVKAASIAGSERFTVKVASGFYENPARGLPSGSGLMLVFDAATGFPVALLQDNGYLTDLRTGAAGALAARALAPAQLERVAVIGSGVQARFQLRALAGVRRWSETRVWSPHPERARRCCEELERELDGRIRAMATAEAAIRGADVVITVTPATQPVVHAGWLEPHATVLAIGSDGPAKQELSVDVLLRADKVVVDVLAQCLRLGELHHAEAAGVLPRVRLHGELGDVVTGAIPGREGDELIVCDLTGTGAQDAAIADAAWRLAR